MRQLLISLVITGIMVFSIVDIVTIDSSRVKHMPKFFWVLLTILLSVIGSLLWFLVGRERLEPREGGGYSGQSGRAQPPRRPQRRGPVAPDDDPEFLQRLGREAEQEDRIRKLEERLGELDDDKPAE